MTDEQFKFVCKRLDTIEAKVNGWLYTAITALVSSAAALVTALTGK